MRLSAIAVAGARIKAKSFTIDGEAVVLEPDGLSRFDELRGRDAAYSAMLYAFVGAAKLARGTNHPNAKWSGQ